MIQERKTYTVGMDEIATGNQNLYGWCYCIIPQNEEDSFNDDSQKIQDRPRIFHGKKYRRTDKSSFEQFLKIIKSYSETHDGSQFGVFFLSKPRLDEIKNELKNIINEAMHNMQIEFDPEIIATLALPCYMSLDWIDSGLEGCQYDFKIEQDQETDRNKDLRTNNVPILNLVRGICNAHSKLNSLDCVRRINYVRPSLSNIVQAADVIGNFVLGFLKHKLGWASTKGAEKSDIFLSAFSSLIENDPPILSELCLIDDDLEFLSPKLGRTGLQVKWL